MTEKGSATRFNLAAYGPGDELIRSEDGNAQVIRVELHADGVVLALDDIATKATAFAIKLSPDTAKTLALALNHVAFQLSDEPAALAVSGGEITHRIGMRDDDADVHDPAARARYEQQEALNREHRRQTIEGLEKAAAMARGVGG
jgi:hypothetical protein